MQGEDRRDPSLRSIARGSAATRSTPGLTVLAGGGDTSDIGVECLANTSRALGWIYNIDRFSAMDPAGKPSATNLVLRFDGMADGDYQAQFWNTLTGKPILSRDVSTQSRTLRIPVPPLVRDMAFKLRREE
jgi:hypothetical protein